MIIINKSILKKIYQKRILWCHKGDFGKLIIIGGSKKYSGSPAFNALSAISAYKTGVDTVEVIAPERAANIIASFSPDMITYPLEGEYIEEKHLPILLKQSKNKTSFVIGGGIEKNPKTLLTIRNYLKKINLPGVIDADAIYAVNPSINLEKFVITPHEKEFEILTRIKPSRNLKQRIRQVKNAAEKLNTTILLKGHFDIISNENKIAVNKTGTPYMTKGGTGDTLAGILGSLIAQKNFNLKIDKEDLFNCACAAAYINGKAGELVKKSVSLTASDLIKKIEKVVE